MIRHLLAAVVVWASVLTTASAPAQAAVFRVEVHFEPCPYFVAAGCAVPDAAGTIYVHPVDPYVLLHEMGHQFDWQVLDPRLRNIFAPAQPWDQELFADSFASCILGYPSREAGNLRQQRQYRRRCRFIQRVAG